VNGNEAHGTMAEAGLVPQRRLLERLIVGNTDLERLESMLRRFNLFVAMDAVHHEVRHSNFLAYLLDPRKNHGLGSLFLKRFLQAALASRREPGIAPVDIELWRSEGTEVLREWKNIDIMLRDQANRIAVIIENKIDSKEHSNQLQRYFDVSEHEFQGWTIVPIYLTPGGEPPSDSRYVAMSYAKVCAVLEQLAAPAMYPMNDEVRLGLRHYAEMLRRYVVAESEISELCRRIYEQHREALDLIYEHRPDRQAAVSQLLEALITEHPDLELDTCGKSLVRFWVKKLDVTALRQSANWTPSRRILLFEFDNRQQELKLFLYIGPGPVELRRKLYDIARDKKPLKPLDAFRHKWNAIFSRHFMRSESYEKSWEEFEEILKTHWNQFLTADLPAIIAILEAERWIFQEEPTLQEAPIDAV
jgi:hypothetical protein